MRFTLVRTIHFHSSEAGLVSRQVSKEVESEISPRVGFDFDDSAWHRNDVVKADSISIDTETGECTVTLNSKEVSDASRVEAVYNTALQHGWKDWPPR